MKKIILLLLISFYIPDTFAFLCRNKMDGSIHYGGYNADIYIPVDDNLEYNNENIFANVADYIECWNEAPENYIDYLETDNNTAVPGPVFSSLTTGIYLNGSRYLSNQVPQKNVFKITDPGYFPINIQLFFVTPQLGNHFIIEKGDHLMTLNLIKYTYYIPTGKYQEYNNFSWTFIAANRAVLTAGSCTINNNENIYVDFGLVLKSKILNAEQGLSSVSKTLDLNIDCHDLKINNQKIKLTIKSDSSPFSNGAIATDRRNELGIEVYHKNQLIKPNDSFNSTLFNGQAIESILISLVKSPKIANESLTDGEFNANASLILSMP